MAVDVAWLNQSLVPRCLLLTCAEFKRHVARVYNMRAQEMDSQVCRLALFIDPTTKDAAGAKTQLKQLLVTAGTILQRSGISQGDAANVMQHMRRYATGMSPYDAESGGPDFDIRAWWLSLEGVPKALLALVLVLLDAVPTAATIERLFSLLGWYQDGKRCNLSAFNGVKLMSIRMALDREDSASLAQGDAPPTKKQRRQTAVVRRREEGRATRRQAELTDSILIEVSDDDAVGERESDGEDGGGEIEERTMAADGDVTAAQVPQLVEQLANMYEYQQEYDQANEVPAGMSFMELLMDNWDGFDMTHAAFNDFDYCPQHVQPPPQPTLRSTATSNTPEAYDLAELAAQVVDDEFADLSY